MESANEFLGRIIEKCGKEIGIELFKALCSVACAFLTQKIWVTLFYIFGTTLFDILTKISEEISLENLIKKLFEVSNTAKYILLTIIAVLPTIMCFLFREITYSDLFDLLEKRAYNLVPNLFGALIVCSFIKYLSKFKVEEIMCTAVCLKKELFDTIIRCGFMIAFLNAINHAIRDEQRMTELFNAFHLYVVIFSGMILLVAFALWLVSKNAFDLSKTPIFPTFSLVWCFCFLLSCTVIPGVFEKEWLLLCFNGLTTLIISWSFFVFIKRKGNINFKDCPYIQLTLFSALVVCIMIYSITNMGTNEKDSMIRQLISGTFILGGAVLILLVINSFQKKWLSSNT